MRNGKGLIVGVDLGGTKMHAAAVDENGTVLASERCKTLPEEGADAVIGRIAGLVKNIAGAVGASTTDVQAMCIGVPGGVNDAAGVVDTAPNLGWEKVPLARLLNEQLGGQTRVFLDNDVRVAVLGEHAYGLGRGTQTMVGIFVGTGIGGGVVINGQLHHGSRGAAGEFGHMILEPKGPKCPCGKRGCAEALASRTSMERDVRRKIARGHKSMVLKLMKKEERPRLTSSVVATALEERDKVMTRVFSHAQRYIGMLVANVVNAIDPEVVVIGGGLAERLGESMVAPIREEAYDLFLLQRDRDKVKIEATVLKDTAAPAGAAFVARTRLGMVSSARESSPRRADSPSSM
jgi:glucokinase